MREGEPDTLLDLGMTLSEWAPNTFTTGQYVSILGDFRHYWIVDALSMQIQRMLIRRISARRSASIGGRPPRFRDFQRQ